MSEPAKAAHDLDLAEMQRILFEESVRGFLLEHHLPFDTADEWTDAILAIADDHPPTLGSPEAPA